MSKELLIVQKITQSMIDICEKTKTENDFKTYYIDGQLDAYKGMLVTIDRLLLESEEK